MQKIILITLLIIAHIVKANSQLKQQKDALIKQMNNIKQTISKTSSSKKNNVSYLQGINAQVNNNTKLINSINKEIKDINSSIQERIASIEVQNKELNKLQLEYSEIIYICSKTINKVDRLMYIFFADSFNNLTQRIEYIKQYSRIRQMHFKEIALNIEKIQNEKQLLEKENEDKVDLLKELKNKKYELEKLKREQTNIIKVLDKKIGSLNKDLKNKIYSLDKLEKTINQSISKINKPVPREDKKDLSSTLNKKIISNNFRNNKGTHAWPVKSGFISNKFGISQHPVMKNITINNIGIEIQTTKNAVVHAIYNGVVKAIVQITGMSQAVIIKHGDYYSVYARLSKVTVKEGQTIGTNTVIGNVANNSDDMPELHFQIWYKNQKINPSIWLATIIK